MKGGSDNKLRDVAVPTTIYAGIMLAILEYPVFFKEALYPYFGGIFLIAAFIWTASVNGLKQAVQYTLMLVALFLIGFMLL